MSYINDALRKAQKDKESGYAAYGNIVSASGKNPDRSKKWLSIIGILAVFFFAAGIIALLYWPTDTRIPAKIKIISASPLTAKVPAQKISALPVSPEVANASSTKPQVVKETTEDKKNKTGLNRETASSTPKVKPEIAEAKALFAQALDRQHEGKLEEAKRLYREVVKIDKDNVQAFNNLGVIHMSQKKYKWAIKRFNDAINVKHDYPDAHYNLACLYAQKNDIIKSLSYLKNAIRYNPEVRHWAENDGDLKTMAELPEFKKLLEKQ